MSLMDRLSALVARKSSRGGAAVAAVGLAPARWTPRRYDRLAEEGYRRNVVAYRCVREVARACASVPWLLYRGDRELDTHPALGLLRRPNPRQSGPELVEAAIGHLLLSGNAYLEVVRPDGEPPRELYALRPDRMRVLPDVSGVPRAYRYEVEGRTVDWPVDPLTGESDVLHLRDFHPLDDWYGLSPIEAAAVAIDQHNAAAEHNAALLQNGARPSGALVFRADPGPDGIRRVEEALLDRTQSPRNAGRPLVLGGDVDWKELGLSPRDMDFAQMKAQAAREIAAAFGVPHLLVVSGEATYSNRIDARLELWEHTVIPLLDRLSSALSTWLGPMFGDDLRLAHDLDEVPALAPRRRLRWQQISQAGFLTLNEKRQALGYEPIDEGDGGPGRKGAEGDERFDGDGGTPGAAGPAEEAGERRSVDWSFIEARETLRRDAYVLDNHGRSGVTIGIGFDFGHWSEADFDRLALDPADKQALRERFRGFFGAKGPAAAAALSAYKRRNDGKAPSISDGQARALYDAARRLIYDRVRDRYNRDLQAARVETLPRFEELPGEAQTAILSLAYQYGPDLRRRTPRYWDRIVRQDWAAAVAELRDFRDAHGQRRKAEAGLLEAMIARGASGR